MKPLAQQIKIQLYLRGKLFQEEDIEIMRHANSLSFPDNVELRSDLLNFHIKRMKAMYHRQIDKLGGDYEIYLQVQSKINLITDKQEA